MGDYSRRQFGKTVLGSIPLASAILASSRLSAEGRPNSVFNGLQIGIICPYSYHNMPGDAKSLLDDMVRDGISACEFHAEPIEEFLGGPPAPARFGTRGVAAGNPGATPANMGAGSTPSGSASQQAGRAQLTAEQLAAQKAAGDAATSWRTSVSMDKFTAFRKMYADAGVRLYAYKLELTLDMPDAEYDYTFNAAKALGCSHVTMELPSNPDLAKRVGAFAAKHEMMVGYHAHTQAKPTSWDQATALSPYNGINLDIGHYVAAGNHDVIAFIQKNHARITSVHLKDRKYPEAGGDNVAWGTGDTPVKEVLRLIKSERYPFPATIELEYAPPEGSNSEKEIVKCLEFAKAALA